MIKKKKLEILFLKKRQFWYYWQFLLEENFKLLNIIICLNNRNSYLMKGFYNIFCFLKMKLDNNKKGYYDNFIS